MDEQEIGRGAEAVIYKTQYRGRDAVVKVRTPKGYRHPDLDRHLRNMRTKNEVRVIRDARSAGVRTPVVYDIDLGDSSITMEYFSGRKVKDILDEEPERAPELCAKIGEMVAKLHNHKICHGDLTTSNMIIDSDGRLGVIDFSLGDTNVEIEELGVDIHLLERAFTSAHSKIEGAYGLIIDSYRKNMPEADAVLQRVEDIKGRARYT
jgi:TP53 regulating kinase-like protein